MIIMQPGATKEQVENVIKYIEKVKAVNLDEYDE